MCGILLQIISSLPFKGLKELLTLCNSLKLLYSDLSKKPQVSESQDIVALLTSQNLLKYEHILPWIKARGPDHFSSLKLNFQASSDKEEVKESMQAQMGASVLSLRGEGLTPQPLQSEHGVLIYNGQLYTAIDTSHCSYDPSKNDGMQLLQSLDLLASQTPESDFCQVMQIHLFQKVEGQFALVYYSKRYDTFFICKDRIGRRSLLISSNHEMTQIQVGSVLPEGAVFQIPNSCLIKINSKREVAYSYPFKLSQLRFQPQQEHISLKSYILVHYQADMDETMQKLLKNWEDESQSNQEAQFVSLLLYGAVRSRIMNISSNSVSQKEEQKSSSDKVAVLFSGGIDSTLLAVFTHLALPSDVQINLVNVSFDPSDSPDRLTSILAQHELRRLFPQRKFELLCIDTDFENECVPAHKKLKSLIHPSSSLMDLNIASALHFASTLNGYALQYSEQLGVSCQEQILKMEEGLADPAEFKELIKTMKKVPHDYKIPTKLLTPVPVQKYKASGCKLACRVLLSGLGADQVFGGYARYSSGFIKDGYAGIAAEMSKDLDRLWIRNLGRDDRAMAQNAKECRFPFLDSRLIKGMSLIPLEKVVDFEMPRGQGEKKILREIAKNFGFRGIHGLEKRAIQFGTKIAKLSNKKEFGSNRQANGKAQINK